MRTIDEALAKIDALERLRNYIAEMKPTAVETVVEYIDAFIRGTRQGMEAVAFAGPDDLMAPPPSPRVVCSWCGVEMAAGREPISHGCCADCHAEMLRRMK